MPRTPLHAQRTLRSADAAAKRYLKSESYRKVAASGGGAREVARRAKQAQAIEDKAALRYVKEARARRLQHGGAAAYPVDPRDIEARDTIMSAKLLGKTHTQRLLDMSEFEPAK